MKARLKRSLASILCSSLAWTLGALAGRPQGSGAPELNVVHYKAPEFPVAELAPLSDESDQNFPLPGTKSKSRPRGSMGSGGLNFRVRDGDGCGPPVRSPENWYWW